MKLKSILKLIILCITFGNCSEENHSFWKVTDFNIDENILEDFDEVVVLYYSGSIGKQEDLDYYRQAIVVSQKTGDTINILSFSDILGIESGKVFKFLSINNVAFKAVQQYQDDPTKFEEKIKLSDIKLKDINVVIRFPDQDYITRNNYPTIIGDLFESVPDER
jgi:hypothetical protein